MEGSDGAVIAESLETPGAFGVIFDRHGSTLLRFLARRVDPAEAEDLLGEVFRIAFERRSAFEQDRDSARPWLYGIAANLVAKHHRGEARRLRAMARVSALRASAARLLEDDPAERAVAAADAGALWPRVVDAIGTLPEAERQVLLAWLELGDGVVMIGRAGEERHGLHSPLEAGVSTAMVNAYVHDIDAHCRRAEAEGARIVMPLEDMARLLPAVAYGIGRDYRGTARPRPRGLPGAGWWAVAVQDPGLVLIPGCRRAIWVYH